MTLEVKNNEDSKKASILWISFTILDISLNRTAVLDILRALSNLGYNTSLIAVRSKNKNVNAINTSGKIIAIPLRCTPFMLPVMFAIIVFLYLPFYIIKFKPDFVVLDPDVHVLASFFNRLFFRLKKIKFILDIRSTPVEAVGLRNFFQKFWFSIDVLIAKKAFAGITIITPMMRKEVCNTYHIDPSKIGVWTSGVSDSLFRPTNVSLKKAELKRKLGIDNKFIVFYHGVFSASRGLTETVEAIRLLKSEYNDIIFFLLGTGPIVNKLSEMVKENNLSGNVVIHNPVEQTEVPKFIELCDVGIVPLPHNVYWRFQSPLKLLEYLAMEKVVIVSDIPAHRMVIGDEPCGIFISSITPQEIAKSIKFAYQNKDRFSSWGKKGRTIIKNNYEWGKVAKDLEDYLLSI